jgi:hypothetical protein
MKTDVELHAVMEFATSINVVPRGVILLLRHASFPLAVSGVDGEQTSVILSPDQAEALSDALAKKAWQARNVRTADRQMLNVAGR